MILEIDAGNTRLKWRLTGTGEQPEIISAGNVEASEEAACLAVLSGKMESQPMGQVKRIRVSSVRGAQFRDTFTSMASENWGIQPEFARVQYQCSGVTNAYEDTNTMGVDRWLAMLAAYDKRRGACCVLDCGSAITFDWIDKKGDHQGGYIAPGLKLMQESLSRKAPALNVALDDWGSPEPGNSTKAAINGGILAMVVGFARQCREHMDGTGVDVHWFLTGGDAELLGKYLDWPHSIEKDLVLDGLALSLP